MDGMEGRDKRNKLREEMGEVCLLSFTVAMDTKKAELLLCKPFTVKNTYAQ